MSNFKFPLIKFILVVLTTCTLFSCNKAYVNSQALADPEIQEEMRD